MTGPTMMATVLHLLNLPDYHNPQVPLVAMRHHVNQDHPNTTSTLVRGCPKCQHFPFNTNKTVGGRGVQTGFPAQPETWRYEFYLSRSRNSLEFAQNSKKTWTKQEIDKTKPGLLKIHNILILY